MPYEINKTNSSILTTVQDNSTSSVAGLTLIGRSRSNYGESFNENLIKLAENFANGTAPADGLVGQLWWDTGEDRLNVKTGAGWIPIGTAIVDNTAPAGPSNGTFWFDSSSGSKQLKVYDGTQWQIIGPAAVGSTGATGLFTNTVASPGGNKTILELTVAGVVVAIIAAEEFTPTTPIPNFPLTIVPGMNFRRASAVSELLTKTMSIEEAGIIPVTDNATNLGASSFKWANVYATTFTGALTGNATSATSATSATNATNATNIAITANTDNSDQPLVFVSTTTGNLGARVESNLTYNPDATEQLLKVPNIESATVTATGAVEGETLVSTVATGTAPLTVASTTTVANLSAATADKWNTARSVTFATGDVTGTFSIDGSANVTNVALTIAANSVVLGTDTVGNYVEAVSGTNGIAITGTAGEGWSPSVGLSTTTGGQIFSLGVNTAASGTAGEIRATNDITAYYTSDITLKENITPILDPLQKLASINGVFFDWTDDFIQKRGGEDGFFVRKKDIGLIAQEVEKVFPEVVGHRENGTMAVKYDRLVSVLIEAVKELNQEVSSLKEKLSKVLDK